MDTQFSLTALAVVSLAFGALGFYWGAKIKGNKMQQRINRLKQRLEDLQNPQSEEK
jgi:hypothetical protein